MAEVRLRQRGMCLTAKKFIAEEFVQHVLEKKSFMKRSFCRIYLRKEDEFMAT